MSGDKRFVLKVEIVIDSDEWAPGFYGDPTDRRMATLRSELATRLMSAVDSWPGSVAVVERDVLGVEY